jgi:hypothetical protein
MGSEPVRWSVDEGRTLFLRGETKRTTRSAKSSRHDKIGRVIEQKGE